MFTDPETHAIVAAQRAELLRADYGKLRLPRKAALRVPAWLRSTKTAARLRSSRA
jgi:hypothetical protein